MHIEQAYNSALKGQPCQFNLTAQEANTLLYPQAQCVQVSLSGEAINFHDGKNVLLSMPADDFGVVLPLLQAFSSECGPLLSLISKTDRWEVV
jgi:hypothetical protein